jgi:methionyl-tRNA formyltransferase
LDRAERIRVVFFGTPEYAVPTLRALAVDPHFDLRLAVTQPDRPAGRGHRLLAPPVKSAAADLDATVIQPSTLRDESVREYLRALDADVFVVAAYGLIFGQAVLEIPRFGCLNLHASILPRYRGAAPIPAAILNGDPDTGVTLMMMERGLDTGPIVAVGRTQIGPSDTTATLTERLAEIGASLALDAIPDLVAGRISPVPQPADATSVRQLTKADGQVDWRRPAIEIERQIRAMWPWPRGWTSHDNATIQIHAVSVSGVDEPPANSKALAPEPGMVRVVDGKPAVVCGDGASLVIEQGQVAGGRPQSGADLVRGRILTQWLRLDYPTHPPEPLIRAVES